MRCSRALALYDAIGETQVGTRENREARAAYLEHIKRCRICQDHYESLVEWAREMERHSYQENSVSTETEGG